MRRVLLAWSTLFAACQCGTSHVTPSSGRLLVEPTSLDFGQQETGSQTRLRLTLINTGSAQLEVSVAVSGDARAAFAVATRPVVLAAGSSQPLEVAYAAPTTPGIDSATLSLETDAIATPEVLVPLLGRSAQPCVPRSCVALGSACGTHLECGETVACGVCASGRCEAHACVAGADDAGVDAGTGQDAGVDAGTDAGPAQDAGLDAGVDAGTAQDAGVDAGTDAGVDAGVDAGFSVDPSRRYVFTTNASYAGNLGGIVGADVKCNLAATSARLPGTYRALLIISGQTLAQRVPDAGPWFRVDGQLAFQDATEVLSAPRVPLNVSETGLTPGGYGSAWTGVIRYGGVSGSTCTNWTDNGAGSIGKMGSTSSTTSSYIDDNPASCSTFNCGALCSTALHLYCIEE